MKLDINQQLFIIGGATSGFGLAVTQALIEEGASVIAVARGKEKIEELVASAPQQVEGIIGDITQSKTIQRILTQVGKRHLSGMLVNAGGPPAMSFLETKMEDWDAAYQSVLRWKIEITQALAPKLIAQKYGRLVYVESVSVKQPIENLVLSNSLRLGVVGFVKTLSEEIAHHGVTLNILAPGYHATPRMENLLQKKSEREGISLKEARSAFAAQTKTGQMGEAADFASLAMWLLSPVSRYITGQTISVDGGLVKGTMG
ncbi:MAG: SDR family oxidoreductase [Chitinophagales bacterium]